MTTVLIADDQELVRTGFRLILAREADIEVVADAANGDEAVRQTVRHRPDVVLMDIRMPVRDGLAATKLIVADDGCPSRVIILTTFDDDEYVYEALAAGASGFLLKDTPADDLIHAIHAVAAGDAVLSPAVTRRMLDTFGRQRTDPDAVAAVARLSDREREVLQQIAAGLTNAEIAAALFLAEATVKTHVARILQKLPARDRVRAVILAYRSGLVDA